jgi:hypothetical protein
MEGSARRRKLTAPVLVASLGPLVSPCGGGGASSPPLTVTLRANPTNLSTGDSATLSWSGNQATSCTASGAWSGTRANSGCASTGPRSAAGTFTYVLTCSNASESQTGDCYVDR